MNDPGVLLAREHLSFSQGSLQDYLSCRRLFKNRYLLRLAWPAIQSEPVLEQEVYLRQGALFHRMVQRLIVGVDADALEVSIQDDDLKRWWDNFLLSRDIGELSLMKYPGFRLFPEITLTSSLNQNRLVAKCDLVVVSPAGEVTIFDWKTTRKKPSRETFSQRIQTHIYPYLVVRAGAFLNRGEPVKPEDVKMIYWFSDYPDKPEIFIYEETEFLSDEKYLETLVDDILDLPDDAFYKTEHVERCSFCVYRSLCERGIGAGKIGDPQYETALLDHEDLDIDFEQIPETAF